MCIMRRYFVVNGFDGALTSLGLIMGFYVSARDFPFVVRPARFIATTRPSVNSHDSGLDDDLSVRRIFRAGRWHFLVMEWAAKSGCRSTHIRFDLPYQLNNKDEKHV